MKNLRKIISAMLCVVIVLTMSLTTVVFADKNDIMYDLKSLGIVGGFGFEDHLDSNITRGEFAQLVVNMMNHKDIAITMETASYFNDVADSPYKGAINLLYKEEIVSGTGNGTFEPNRNVRYTEACKMLVKALGYHVIVSDQSLNSYTFLAGTIGVTDGVDTSKEFITVRDMLVMVDNCLGIGRMIPMYYNANMAPSYIIDEDDTFRNGFERPTPDGTIKMEGIVTADISSYMYTERKSLKDTQLEISGGVYNFGSKAPLGLVGKHVNFYIEVEADGGYGNVISITPTNKNVTSNIYGGNVKSYSNGHIEFYINDTKTTEIETNLSTKWIYNGTPVSYCLDSVNMDGNVQIIATDNNEDEIFDVVSIREYTDAIVERADADSKTVTFETGYLYKNEKNMCFDEDKENIKVIYFDSEGNVTNFEAIKQGDVLSIAKSNDGKIIMVVVSSNCGTALAEGKDGDYITLGTTEYKVLGVDASSVKIGRNYEYKVNFLNRLVYIDEVIVESDYAYTYKLSGATGLNTPKVQLLIPSKVSSKTIQGEFDEETNSTASSTNLYIKNDNLLVYNFANKVTLEYWAEDANGEKYLEKEKVSPNAQNLSKVMNQPVSFEVDNDNKIIRLSQITPSSVGGRLTYNSSEKVFAKTNAVDPFRIDNDTYAVCIPTNDATEDDLLNYIQELLNNVVAEVDAYDVDEDTHVAKVLVIKAEMISNVNGALDTSRNYIGMVKKASRVYNTEDGSESIKLTLLTKGDEKTVCEQSFVVSTLIPSYNDFYNINSGDLIRYSLDGFGRVNAYKTLREFGTYFDGDTGTRDSDFTIYGVVTDIDYDEIDNGKVRVADLLTIEHEDGTERYYLYHHSSMAPQIYILNSANRDVEVGTIADIKY
ncbi:MAG: S-layer homology domain-containing protein, partial [Clostridia bacterium]|nr:S-layer homology domain-containing protein [Clostridia bacterium]